MSDCKKKWQLEVLYLGVHRIFVFKYIFIDFSMLSFYLKFIKKNRHKTYIKSNYMKF